MTPHEHPSVETPNRIVTRPDFDGVVCAVLLRDALEILQPVAWTEPADIQKGWFIPQSGDVLANLPYSPGCSMWFDHHVSNHVTVPFQGAFRIAPSAAGVIYDYYRSNLKGNYRELVAAADKIDSAALSLEEVRNPDMDPYLLVSMTLPDPNHTDPTYPDHLVRLLQSYPIHKVLTEPIVSQRCDEVLHENRAYETHLRNHTTCQQQVSITDFRNLNPPPSGNRFLVYALFPDCHVNVKIRYDQRLGDMLAVSVGHSIFRNTCRVNIGRLLQRFEGGGHQAVGACRFSSKKADQYLPPIIDALIRNEPNE